MTDTGSIAAHQPRYATTTTTTTRSRTGGWWWFALSAVAIAVLAPLPYLGDSLRALAEDKTSVAANYADRALWAQTAFYLHITFGGLALLLAPVQFAARLRTRAPRMHRVLGRIGFGAIGVAGAAGLVMAPLSLAGPVGTAGFGTLAVLWLGFGVAAFRAIRRRDIAAHRRWAVRVFAMTYAAVTLRLWLGVLMAVQIGMGVGEQTAFARAYPVVAFLCWVPNLLIAERFIRNRRSQHAEQPQTAARMRVAAPNR